MRYEHNIQRCESTNSVLHSGRIELSEHREIPTLFGLESNVFRWIILKTGMNTGEIKAKHIQITQASIGTYTAISPINIDEQ